MTEAVQLELVRDITASVPGIAAAWFAYRAATHAKEASIQARQTEENTNHLKDELVASVKDAAYQAGVKSQKEGRPKL